MSDELNEFNTNGEQMPPPPPTQSNRTFLVAIAVLGGVFLLILLAIAAYFVFRVPQNLLATRNTQIASINMANTATSSVMTKVAISAEQTLNAPTATPLPTSTSTPTPKPQPTSVIAQATSTNTVAVTPVDTRTATVAALLTQAAQAKLTTTLLPTSTQLPKTGFADDVGKVGIPSLVGITLLLLVVIFLVRRMRTSSVS
jgi:cytoskeletal protein RodZ